MQISLKLIRLINHAKITISIKFQLLVTFSSLFTGSSSFSVFPRSVLYVHARRRAEVVLKCQAISQSNPRSETHGTRARSQCCRRKLRIATVAPENRAMLQLLRKPAQCRSCPSNPRNDFLLQRYGRNPCNVAVDPETREMSQL